MRELVAPEGKMYVCRKAKMVAYALMLPDGASDTPELLDEAEALKLDREWNPSLYADSVLEIDPEGKVEPTPPSNAHKLDGGGFVDKVHEKLARKG